MLITLASTLPYSFIPIAGCIISTVPIGFVALTGEQCPRTNGNQSPQNMPSIYQPPHPNLPPFLTSLLPPLLPHRVRSPSSSLPYSPPPPPSPTEYGFFKLALAIGMVVVVHFIEVCGDAIGTEGEVKVDCRFRLRRIQRGVGCGV